MDVSECVVSVGENKVVSGQEMWDSGELRSVALRIVVEFKERNG